MAAASVQLLEIRILGKPWQVLVVPEDEFQATYGVGCMGVTKSHEKRIILPFGCSRGVVRHELLHAFYGTLPLQSAGLRSKQVEEVCADLLCDFLDDILALTRIVFKGSRKKRK